MSISNLAVLLLTYIRFRNIYSQYN